MTSCKDNRRPNHVGSMDEENWMNSSSFQRYRIFFFFLQISISDGREGRMMASNRVHILIPRTWEFVIL